MKMKNKGNMTNIQLVIGAVMTGRPLRSGEICEMITERELSVKDVSSLLSKISNEKRCPLGYFINRKQEGGSFVYLMAEEALDLSEDQAYGLTLKTGENRYTLDQALEDFPELRKYVDSATAEKAAKPEKKLAAKKTAEKAGPAKPVKEEASVTVLEPLGDPDKLLDLIQKIAGGNLNINLRLSVKLEE